MPALFLPIPVISACCRGDMSFRQKAVTVLISKCLAPLARTIPAYVMVDLIRIIHRILYRKV